MRVNKIKEPDKIKAAPPRRLSIGDKAKFEPMTFCEGKSIDGTVVYIHPRRRFIVAEFEMPFGVRVRESFKA